MPDPVRPEPSTNQSEAYTIPEPQNATDEVVHIRREDLDNILTSVSTPALQLQALQPTSSQKPTFTKPGLSRQYDFNANLLSILSPIADIAPEDFDIKQQLTKVVELLTQRNQLLTVADSNPDVWEFYDHHKKAESMEASNPILAAFLREKKKKEERKPPDPSHHSHRSSPEPPEQCATTVVDLATFETPAPSQPRENQEIERLLVSHSIVQVPDSDLSGTRINPLSVAKEVKKKWKAVVSAIAEKQMQATALSFRWPLNQKETAELKDGRQSTLWRLTPSPTKLAAIGSLNFYDLLDRKRRKAGSTATLASQSGLKAVASIIDSCIDQSVSTGTLTIYKRVKKNFITFIGKFNVPLTALPQLRNVFIAHLIETGKSRSLGYHISALNHFFGPLTGDDLEVQKALLSMATRKGPPVRHRKKASEEDVNHVITWALKAQTNSALRGAMMILFAFSAFLRLSEVCNLHFSDLSYQGSSIWWLLIQKSKTDQKREGKTVAFYWNSVAKDLWDHYCDAFPPSSPSSFIFSSRSGSAITRDFAARQIQKTLGEAGLGSKKLTSHSFRGGAATNALKKGLDAQSVMLAGRWKSFNSFQAYIGPLPV
ncbi:unnamed protein product [Cylicocyclus nassatus]|uniref:Tyr recombinase domain-containing protein n=1 Tax=Cylicocyclus nassatus TaxID=53992 RepID=A0AA36GLD5_CYLNA|nr:unnamed protein product [Cylicocyclus nassatus]